MKGRHIYWILPLAAVLACLLPSASQPSTQPARVKVETDVTDIPGMSTRPATINNYQLSTAFNNFDQYFTPINTITH